MVSVTSRSAADSELTSSIERLIARFNEHHLSGDVDLIRRAGLAAITAHEGQLRRTGEPYVTHPIAVAGIVADLGLDEPTIAAALLHDAVEDTGITTKWLAKEFGDQVAAVVDGVTKLDRLEFDSKEAQQAATIRKMFIAMAHDWRVLLIKLADRLHNMRTISVMPMARQRAIAQETLDVYSPLAHRLGVQQVKWQLEDLSFATLHPKRYAEIEQMVAARAPEREAYLSEVMTTLSDKLESFGIKAEVRGRPKHFWSIYEKMVVGGKEFDEIFDLVGLRVVVDEDRDCWAVLGAIHALWSPVSGRFKDYINSPKFNLYQSLHTTVIGPRGKGVEVQVRTHEMHRRAEFGIAAHWGYKEGATNKEIAWMQRLADVGEEEHDPVAFLEALKLDLGQDEVYVFTPKGRVIALIEGATPIDFAYAVHTEVGHHCVGAKVNGRLVTLDTTLHSADVVEVVTSKNQSAGPSRDWLSIAKSSRAKSKIRQWFQRERREDAIEGGREELTKALRREGLPIATSLSSSALVGVVTALNLEDLDALFIAIDSGQISAMAVVQRLDRELHGGEAEQLPTTVAKMPRTSRTERRSAGVYVEGLDDVMIHLARCCSPVPGDAIMGFITQGRGVSIHRDDCSNAVALAQRLGERIIDVEWDGTGGGQYRAVLEIMAFDRSRLLLDVSKVVAEYHLNIISSSSMTSGSRIVRLIFDVELADPAHLSSLLTALKGVDGVFDAFRQLPGTAQVLVNEPVATFQAPIGTHDVLGPESAEWEGLVATFANLAYRYGFSLLVSPIFEEVGVFNRGIGENSEMAKKEMYVFEDRGQRQYALRPEATASIVRAFVQHRPTTPWKVWWVGQIFRYERPQAGRYRQHTQLDVEVLGTDDPAVDVEVISLAWNFYLTIGLRRIRLLINSMGHDECRGAYVALLLTYLAAHEDELCDEHKKTYRENPLRVLDCKNQACINVTSAGPMLIDHICDDCRAHFDKVLAGLASLGIDTTLDPRLVRGFDYYTRTTFEITAEALDGAQNAIGGGGRYDKLSEQLGGKPTSGIGFGSGIERILLTRRAEGVTTQLIDRTLDLFVVDTTSDDVATVLVDRLRGAGFATGRAYDERSMKAQMKVADKSGARFALLIGPTERDAGEVTIRDLRTSDLEQSQQSVAQNDLVDVIAKLLKK